MKIWYWFLRTILYPLSLILCPCKVLNKDRYKKFGRGQIIISNHLGWMDELYLYFGLPPVFLRPLSKKENSGNPLQRAFMESVGVIFINRDQPELSVMRYCINALKAGQVLYICPEGTRNRVNRDLQPFHSGAAMFALQGNANVVPYVIHHKGKPFKRNYAAVGDPVDLTDLFDKRISEAVLSEATERFRVAMQKALDELDAWVESKGYNRKNSGNKMEIKTLNAKYRMAMREYVKSSRGK